MEEVKQEGEAGAAPEVKDTKPAESQDFKKPVSERAREDIYSRFDAKFAAPKEEAKSTDTSSEKEESSAEADLKESSDTDSHSEKISDDSEKSTSVKKGKEPKVDTGDQKMVPLQALHESRERFKKLNLEYREFKTSKETQDKEIQELKDQLAKLQTKLNQSAAMEESNLSEGTDNEKDALRREIADLKRKYDVDQSEKAKQAAQQAQQELLGKIQKVSDELATEGFKGFYSTIYTTEAKLRELAMSGDLTEQEIQDPTVWKKVYKEYVYPDLKSSFLEERKEEILESKKEAKKKASLVSNPGKAPEKPEEEENEAPSFNDFVRNQVEEMKKSHRQKTYKRRV